MGAAAARGPRVRVDVPIVARRRPSRRVVVAEGRRQASSSVDVRDDRRDLLDEILAEPDARTAFAFEDDVELRAALARHGFVHPGEPHALPRARARRAARRRRRCRPASAAAPSSRPTSPSGSQSTATSGRHRASPSRATANVMAEWPYRSSLDCVVEAPDGRFAAYCLMLAGRRESRRRARAGRRARGVPPAAASALPSARSRCGACTRRADDRRSSTANRSRRCALYESIGFRIHATIVGYSR